MKNILVLAIGLLQVFHLSAKIDNEKLVVGSGVALLSASLAGTYYSFYRCLLYDEEFCHAIISLAANNSSGPLSENDQEELPKSPKLMISMPFMAALISIIGFNRVLFQQESSHDLEIGKGILLSGASLCALFTSEIIRYWKYKKFGLHHWRDYTASALRNPENKKDIRIRAMLNTGALLGMMGYIAGNLRVLEALNCGHGVSPIGDLIGYSTSVE